MPLLVISHQIRASTFVWISPNLHLRCSCRQTEMNRLHSEVKESKSQMSKVMMKPSMTKNHLLKNRPFRRKHTSWSFVIHQIPPSL